MDRFFKKDILYFIPVIFIIVAVIRAVITYNDMEAQEYNFAKSEAEVLNAFMMTHRRYYQHLYISHVIPLNEKTLQGLPAFSSSLISSRFSERNALGITIKTVSDRARNFKNSADKDENEAIEYFRKNLTAENYFTSREDYYQFANVLKIEQKCLQCHGSREAAPVYIREKYTMAYDYVLGDVRGIVSIKIPKENLNSYFFKQFLHSIIYDFVLLALLFVLLNYVVRRFRKNNLELEQKVSEKTREISTNNAVLQSYIKTLDRASIISKTDLNGVLTYVNTAFIQKSGYSEEELIGQPLTMICHPDTMDFVYEEILDALKSKKGFYGTVNWLTKDQRKLTLQISALPILDENGEIIEYIAARQDITELTKSKEELKMALFTDALTGLPNRYHLLRMIEKHHKRGNLALVNIDNFKEINDFYGHNVGDRLLVEVADTLNDLCIHFAMIFKLPSDEFALFSDRSISSELFQMNVRTMLTKVSSKMFDAGEYAIYISFGCGIASGYDELLIKADMALKSAKSEKKHLVVYDRDIDTSIEIARNLEGISILKKAIEKDKLVPLFQPIYNLKDERVDKYECLARIEDDYGYYLSPASFLEIAKRSKLYPHISRSMIAKSFAYFEDKNYEFAINLSIQDVFDSATVEFIKSKLESFKDSHRVIFEITENEKIENYAAMKAFVTTVKSYGAKIAIDDFGSGYANFEHILELDADYIKIDASLVKKIDDEHSRILVQGIVDFCKRLNIKTIAEYVETAKSMETLREIGVDYVQGYLIGKPSVKLL